MRDLVHVAGRRWTVEESFRTAKGHAGLDEYQVRRWSSWHCVDGATLWRGTSSRRRHVDLPTP